MLRKIKLRRPSLKVLLVSAILLLGLSIAALSLYEIGKLASEPPIRSHDTAVLGERTSILSLRNGERSKVFTSVTYEAPFQFNAIAPHWEEKYASEENRTLEIRTSLDKKQWSAWMEIEALGPTRDNDPYPDRMFAETPLFVDGKYFQYKLTLERSSALTNSPQISDLKINQIDSRESKIQRMIKRVASTVNPTAHAANADFKVMNRAEWGSPDPYGEKFRGTNLHWQPTYSPVKQVFIHHTVTPSYQSDPAAAVRAIWDYHANTRGWGDIGYNYLIDHQGTVYQGRYGGDNVTAGHVSGYNKGSMGVALLGCFESTSSTCDQLNGGNTAAPAAHVINSLTTLLSRKTTSFEINPTGWNTHCDTNGANCLNIPSIASHRDAMNTSCPGDLTYQRLQDIRESTAAKNAEQWTYSAKQLSYGSVDLSSTSPRQVTLSFKNTGSATWSNTTNRLFLHTAEPAGRKSAFKDSGWLSDTTPALLNESEVLPGSTGTFTFNINRPSLATDFYFDALRLTTENGSSFGGFHILPVHFFCTIGYSTNPRADGLMIRDPSNGKIYLLEAGQKRHIVSPLAAVTHRLPLYEAINTGGHELRAVPDGPLLGLGEGTLLKSKDSDSIYILDESNGTLVKRHISSPTALRAFDLDSAPLYIVSSSHISSYGTGSTVYASSPIPDGLLVKSDAQSQIYATKDGKKEWILSPTVLSSFGYTSVDMRILSQNKIDNQPIGDNISKLRTGSLFKTSGSSTIYVVDKDGNKRWVTSPSALQASGFNVARIFVLSSGSTASHADGTNVICHL